MLDTHATPRGSTRAFLFGPPALQRCPTQPPPARPASSTAVSATATGTLRLDPGPRVVEVDIMVEGVVFTCLVRADRVVGPMHRGQSAVRFAEPALAAEVHRVAVEAARDAERRGWL